MNPTPAGGNGAPGSVAGANAPINPGAVAAQGLSGPATSSLAIATPATSTAGPTTVTPTGSSPNGLLGSNPANGQNETSVTSALGSNASGQATGGSPSNPLGQVLGTVLLAQLLNTPNGNGHSTTSAGSLSSALGSSSSPGNGGLATGLGVADPNTPFPKSGASDPAVGNPSSLLASVSLAKPLSPTSPAPDLPLPTAVPFGQNGGGASPTGYFDATSGVVFPRPVPEPTVLTLIGVLAMVSGARRSVRFARRPR